MRRRRGSIFQPRYTRDGITHVSPIWMIQYKVNRRVVRESSRSTEWRDAERLLTKRLGKVDKGGPVGKEHKVRITDLAYDLLANYQARQLPSLERVEHALKHLLPYFGARQVEGKWTGGVRASEVIPADVTRYITQRQSEGAKNATVNRELSVLRQMYNLGLENGRVHHPLRFSLLKENVRRGFLDSIEDLLYHLPEYIKPPVDFAYRTGWRIQSEVLTLTWAQLDFEAGEVRLHTSKTGEGRVLDFSEWPTLRTILEAQWQRARLVDGVPYVFHRDGERIKGFRKAWRTATRRAGLAGLTPHDLRRSAVRNMVRSGIREKVAMELTGHKTRSVFDRYHIVSDEDLREAGRKLSVRDSVRAPHLTEVPATQVADSSGGG